MFSIRIVDRNHVLNMLGDVCQWQIKAQTDQRLEANINQNYDKSELDE